MAHQFKPVDRDAELLLPHNMLDWVPEGHAVRVVISTVERLATRDLTGGLVPPAPKGPAAGPARYDPVMLLTVWMYAYLRGVLSTRAVEDRCRPGAAFRVACGREVPDHTTFSRFRQHLFAQATLAEDLFYQVLHVCAYAGLGRLGVVAGDGVKIAANASKEASRAEAGLRRLASQVMDGARKAAAGDEAQEPPLPGTDLLPGGETVPDLRSRAGRIVACLEELRGGREAAAAAAREQGQACLEALAAGTAAGRPPAVVALAAWQLRLEQVIAAQQALIDDWQGRRAAGAGSRLGRRPVDPHETAAARGARVRLAALQAAAEAEAPPRVPRPTAPPRSRPAHTGWLPPRAAPLTSAAPPTSRACTPASKTTASCAASASAACATPPASSCSQASPTTCGSWPPSAEDRNRRPARPGQRTPQTATKPANSTTTGTAPACEARAQPEPGHQRRRRRRHPRLPTAINCNSPYGNQKYPRS